MRSCPKCSKVVEVTISFCGFCGYKFEDDSEIKVNENLIEQTFEKEFTWNPIKNSLIIFIVFLTISLISNWISLSDHSDKILVDVISSILIGVMSIIILIKYWKENQSLLTKSGLVGNLSYILSLSVVFFAFCSLYFWAIGKFLGIELLDMTSEYREHGKPFYYVVMIFCVCPAIFEEICFRGVILSQLKKLMKERDAQVIQSILFSVVHLLPTVYLSHFFMGFLLGTLRAKTKSLYPGMLLHFAWNFWAVYVEYYS